MSSQEQSKPKSEKELKKEAAKAEKLAKFQEKQRKLAEAAAAKAGDAKEKKAKSSTVIEYEGKTKPGEKKGLSQSCVCQKWWFLNVDVSCEMPTAYSPRYVEAAWYQWWVKEGFFRPEYGRDLRYNIW